MAKNVTLFWNIISRIKGYYLYKLERFVFYLNAIFYIFSSFKKPLLCMKLIKQKKYPFILTKKNGKTITVVNRNELSLILKKIDEKIFFRDKNLIIKFSDNRLINFKFFQSIELGIFIENIYSKLNVTNKILVDVGGNVGDSALLFDTFKPKKIIVLEPQPKFFERAKENLKINKSLSEIKIINAALADKRGVLKINYEKSDQSLKIIEDLEQGLEVPQITLYDIISNEIGEKFALKLDCEGCEYNVILNSPENDLIKFSTILIEFHDGFLNIQNRLKSLGFNVKILNCKYTPEKIHRGHLLATKN